jgi:hypothetical protein
MRKRMRDSLIRENYSRCGGKLRRSGRPPFFPVLPRSSLIIVFVCLESPTSTEVFGRHFVKKSKEKQDKKSKEKQRKAREKQDRRRKAGRRKAGQTNMTLKQYEPLAR